PYLYLRDRTIPSDYLIIIVVLLVAAAAVVGQLRPQTGLGRSDFHFFFLGVGFLLLQTKSIGDCSLYFGTTCLVSLIAICGSLLMILAANLLAMRIASMRPWMYLPLFASVLLLIFVPRSLILAQPFAIRLTWALVMMPLPIFFAGLIFSTTFAVTLAP